MTINIPLLRKAVEFAEASAARQVPYGGLVEGRDPSEMTLDYGTDPDSLTWNQGSWAMLKKSIVASPEEATLEHCGTAFCIAGFVATQLDGYDAKLVTEQIGPGQYVVDFVETIDGDDEFSHAKVAREALGISSMQAEDLFYGHNTLADVRRIAENIAGERL